MTRFIQIPISMFFATLIIEPISDVLAGGTMGAMRSLGIKHLQNQADIRKQVKRVRQDLARILEGRSSKGIECPNINTGGLVKH